MTSVVLVRHGETGWHADNRYAGSSDVALSARGMKQAGQLAAWASHAGLVAVWTSHLRRTRATADACAAASAVPLHVDNRLRELDFGEGEGLTTAEMRERFPRALEQFHADPAGHHLPAGEVPHQAADRFLAALGDITKAHPGGRVLVVAHSTVIRLALCSFLAVPLSEYRRLFPLLRNCGLTELLIDDSRRSLLEFNTPLGRGRQ